MDTICITEKYRSEENIHYEKNNSKQIIKGNNRQTNPPLSSKESYWLYAKNDDKAFAEEVWSVIPLLLQNNFQNFSKYFFHFPFSLLFFPIHT